MTLFGLHNMTSSQTVPSYYGLGATPFLRRPGAAEVPASGESGGSALRALAKWMLTSNIRRTSALGTQMNCLPWTLRTKL